MSYVIIRKWNNINSSYNFKLLKWFIFAESIFTYFSLLRGKIYFEKSFDKKATDVVSIQKGSEFFLH